MGWEVFHQATVIPIPIRSMELTSKREDNCNIMVTGPINHGLHVISHMSQFTHDLITLSFHPKILHASASSSSSPL